MNVFTVRIRIRLYGKLRIAIPAANNACIELMPDKVGTITGLRGMFRYVGNAVSIAIITLLLHAISDIHRAFYVVLIATALVLLLSIPIIFIMPSSPIVKPFRKESKLENS